MNIKVNPIKINHNLFDEIKVIINDNVSEAAIITNIELMKTATINKNDDIEVSVVPVYSICGTNKNSFTTIKCVDWGEDDSLDIREYMHTNPAGLICGGE